jgi:lysine-N-methylase
MATTASPLQAERAVYADSFRCIGPACEDTCCSGWQVNIDRASFERYQASVDSPLRVLFAERVLPYPGSRSDKDFARVQLDPDGRCPFLDAERLCRIQAEHGAEALSATCADYPRTARRIDGQPEMSLELSCPEAARTVLLDPQFLRPKDGVSDQRERYASFAAAAAALPPAGGNRFQYFWEVRRLVFLLLQDRSYPLWERLFVLGALAKRLDEAERRPGDIPDLLRSYAEIMAHEKLRGALGRLPARPEAQAALMIDTLVGMARGQRLPRRFLDCLEECLAGLGHREGMPLGAAVAGYADAYRRHYAPFFAEREYMLENYLLSYVVRKRFPFGEESLSEADEGGPLLEFALLALRFALVKGVLVGMAARHGAGFGEGHVVKLVQSFAKGVEHRAGNRADLVQRIRAERLHRSEALAMMLRN